MAARRQAPSAVSMSRAVTSAWVSIRTRPATIVTRSPAAPSRRIPLQRRPARPGHVHEHHVGLHAGRVHAARHDLGHALGQPPGVRVILGQPARAVRERDQAGRGHDPGLPPGPAEQDLQPACFPDELTVPGQQRPDRRAQPLGQAEHQRVHVPGVLGHGRPGHHGRVEDAGAIQVERGMPGWRRPWRWRPGPRPAGPTRRPAGGCSRPRPGRPGQRRRDRAPAPPRPVPRTAARAARGSGGRRSRTAPRPTPPRSRPRGR